MAAAARTIVFIEVSLRPNTAVIRQQPWERFRRMLAAM